MKRTRGGAATRERRKDGAVERGARVQDDFAFAPGAAEFGESADNGREIVVSRAEQDHVRGKRVGGKEAERRAGTDGADSGARRRRRARYDGADSPAALAQALSQRSAYATSAHDRKSACHRAC